MNLNKYKQIFIPNDEQNGDTTITIYMARPDSRRSC